MCNFLLFFKMSNNCNEKVIGELKELDNRKQRCADEKARETTDVGNDIKYGFSGLFLHDHIGNFIEIEIHC
jgi:hypothetical protein